MHPMETIRGKVLLGLGLLLVLHLAIVLSIFRQPLNVSAHPPEARSWIWPLHHDTIHRDGPGADFFSVYHAGWALSEGVSPYAPYRGVVPYHYPFRYLPVVGWGMDLLFAGVGPVWGYLYWILLLELTLFALLTLFLRRIRGTGWRFFTAAVLLWSSPYFLELHMGQFTFLTAALLSFALLPLSDAQGSRIGETILGTLGYSAAVLLKIFPLVAVPALLRQRRGWPVAAGAGVLVVLVSAPYFLRHPDAWGAFWQGNAASYESLHGGNFGFLYLVFQGLRDLGAEQWLLRWPGFVLAWKIVVLGTVALLVLKSREQRLLPLAAPLLLAHFVTYADVWEHHMSAVVVFGLWWLLAAQQAGDRRGLWLTAVSLVLLALPTPYALFDRAADPAVMHPAVDWSFGARLAVAGPKVLGVWLLLGLGLVTLWRAKAPDASAVARPVDASHPG